MSLKTFPIPEISLNTDRLVLRTPIEADFAPAQAMMASERMRFLGGALHEPHEQWRSFLTVAGHWMIKGYGLFTVLYQGIAVGRIGVVNHPSWDEPELGWHLFGGCEGQGFATEAARAARAWAYHARGLGPLISYIVPENAPSQRVARRLGAVVERDGFVLGTPCQIWRHPAEGGAA